MASSPHLPNRVPPHSVVTLSAAEVAKRLRFKGAPSLINGKVGLTRGRHYREIKGARRLVFLWDVICADMGLPHSNFDERDFMLSSEVASYLRVGVATVSNAWPKKGVLREGVHFFYVPGTRHRRLFLREAIQRLAGLGEGSVTFQSPSDNLPAIRLGGPVSPVLPPDTDRRVALPVAPAPPSPLPHDVSSDFFVLLAQRWLNDETLHRPSRDRTALLDTLSNVLAPYFVGYAVHEITRSHCLDVVATVRNEHGPLAAKRCLSILKGVFDKAASTCGIGSPLLPGDDEHTVFDLGPRPLTAVQCQALLAAAPPALRPYFLVRFFTGLNSSEAHSLRWRSVHLTTAQITIDELYRGDAWDPIRPYSPRRRSIPLAMFVRDAIAAHASRCHDDPQSLVFHDGRGGTLTGNDTLQHAWRNMLKACRITPMRLDHLRHTAPYLWLCAGESAPDVARWAGLGTDTVRLQSTYGRLPGLFNEQSPLDRMILAASSPTASFALTL